MEKTLKNLKEMEEFAFYTANKAEKGEKATIFGLYGDLGSGKTTFSKSFCAFFGVKEVVTSPTFVIEKIYKLPKSQNFKHIIHIDAYRLESEEEMEDLGWEEISNNPENIILIEWPEKIEKILPKDMKKIEFKFTDENIREIKYA